MLRFDNECGSGLEAHSSEARDEGARRTTFRFAVSVPANPRVIGAVTSEVRQVLEARKWPEDEVDAVDIALREALANAIRHGCRGDVTQYVRCAFAYGESDEVLLVVRDPGAGFDPAVVPDPFDAANMLNRGGRGLLLIRALMDDVQFVDGGREVRMRKRKGTP
jgi:serine/threonine-protein kinase RsbW